MSFTIQRHPNVAGAYRLAEVDSDLILKRSPWKRCDFTFKELTRQVRLAGMKNEEAPKIQARLFMLFPLSAPSNVSAITFNVEHRIDVPWFECKVRREYEVLVQQGKSQIPASWSRLCSRCGRLTSTHRWDECPEVPSRLDAVLAYEAYRRYEEWSRRAGKKRKYEVFRTPHKGQSFAVKVRRRFKDYQKAVEYAERLNSDPERTASYDIQLRQNVQPVQPKHLLGFDPLTVLQPNQEKIMAKAKVKGKKASANGAGKPKVRKDKAYYFRCMSGKQECGSGDFIRGCILKGGMDAETIVGLARKKFKGHSTKPSDVYWNRGQLKAQGINPPDLAKAK